MTDVNQAAERVRAWLHFDATNQRLRLDTDRLGISYRHHPVTRGDLRAVLADRDRLQARVTELEAELSGGTAQWGIRPEAGLSDEYVLDGYTEAGARHHATRYAPSGRPVRRRTGRWIDAEEPKP